jgi:hypothetical protein
VEYKLVEQNDFGLGFRNVHRIRPDLFLHDVHVTDKIDAILAAHPILGYFIHARRMALHLALKARALRRLGISTQNKQAHWAVHAGAWWQRIN